MASARKSRWTAAELISADFPSIDWVIPNLLPEGLTILAGRPKVGKSWAGLQIGGAVSTGGNVFGQKCKQGKVLMLVLEDGPRRLQQRIRQQGWEPSTRIVFHTDWKPLDKGGTLDLEREISQHGYRVVIIDTLYKALSKQSNSKDDSLATNALIDLHNLTKKEVLPAIIVLDHHTKGAGFNYADDPIDSIMGGTGKAAVADCVWGITRNRGRKGVSLNVRGRDFEDYSLKIKLDQVSRQWQLDDESKIVTPGTLQAEIVHAMVEAGEALTVKALCQITGKPQPQVSKELMELLHKGMVNRGEKMGTMQPYFLSDKLAEYWERNGNGA